MTTWYRAVLTSIITGGFFGPTNFSAVFLENKESLGNEEIQISDDDPFHNGQESLQSQQTFLMLENTDYRGSPRVALGVKGMTSRASSLGISRSVFFLHGCLHRQNPSGRRCDHDCQGRILECCGCLASV